MIEMSDMGWRKVRNYMAMLEQITGCSPEAQLYRKKLSRVYVQDAKAIAGATPADVGEYPNSYVFIVDMPGVKPSEIKVRLEENDNVLMLTGERKRDKHHKENKGDRINYLKMERIGKFTRKFGLPDNANVDAISALYQDGVLTVTVPKLPPPQPKRPRTIEVKVA